MYFKKGLFILLAVVALSYPALAQETGFDHIISNSEDWRDVFSIVHYANINAASNDFLVSTRHGTLLTSGLNRNLDILVLSSRDRSFVLNYADTLQNEGFKAEERIIRNANLELAEEVDATEFIIVGNTYGYSAIAVAPYAVQKKAWVFFADRSNIADIEAILDTKDVNNVMIYGFVDREVRSALERFDPDIINNGDRFEDNIEIVERYLDLRETQQVSLSNGEFIEKSLMSGFDPILFTGKENVPEQIADYLKKSDFSVGVLVGSDLVGAATNIRRTTGISVIVKFAQGARNPTGPIAAVEGLDLYYLPVPVVDLEIHSARFNRATSQLELTYKSNSNIPIFFRGTLTPIDENGRGSRFGDVDAIFIAPDDFKTVSYSDVNFVGNDLSIEVFTLYGDTPSSLERILEGVIDIEIVNAIDGCEIDIKKITYSLPKDAFQVKIENLADVDCWVDVEITDIIIDGFPTTIGSIGSERIKSGRSKKVIIEQELTQEDFEDNEFVDVTAYYGEREDSLVKILQGRYEFNIVRFSIIVIIIIFIIIILILWLLFLLWRRRRDREEDDW